MQTLLVKNMVCDRCKKVLTDELTSLGITIESIKLGEIVIENESVTMDHIKEAITKNGFELIEDNETLVLEQIKLFLLKLVDNLPIQRNKKISTLIASDLNKDYSSLSKLFSKKEGITLEKFFVRLKLEKVKELIQENKYTFSEIAHLLDYANSNHLAKQFKDATGMSMTAYKTSHSQRQPLDKII